MPEIEAAWMEANGGLIDIRFYGDNDCLEIVKEHSPHFVETYTTQLSIVERADYFRYLVVWVYGGLYVDSDIEFKQPVNKWLETFGWYRESNSSSQSESDDNAHMLLSTLELVVGVEFPWPQTGYDSTGWLPVQINQFLFAGAKESSIMKRILGHIELCIATIPRNGNVEMTLERTGPAAFTRAIVNELHTHGLSLVAVRDMLQNSSTDPRHPPVLLPLVELEKNGQLISISNELDPLQQHELSKPNEFILVLPYRAYGFNNAHGGLAPGPVLAFHQNQNSWRKNPGG